MSSKLYVLDLERIVRSFIVMVQRGCGQLVDFLLISWWWGKWEVASSTFWFQNICLWAAYSYLVLPGEGFSICKTAQRYCCVYLLMGNQDPALKATLLFLIAPPLCLHFLYILISNCLNLPFGASGRGCRKSFVSRVPQGPALFQNDKYFTCFTKKFYAPIKRLGFPGDSDCKESACNVGDVGSIPGSGRSPGKGNGNPLHYSCWEIPWAEEPSGLLQSVRSQRIRHNWPRTHTCSY